MPWPFSGGSNTTTPARADQRSLPERAYQAFSSQKQELQLIETIAVTSVCVLGSRSVYKRYVRRIPTVVYIRPNELRNRSIFGRVTSVGDADNFRLYHSPGGKLLGWGWLRKIPVKKEELSGQTVIWPHIFESIGRKRLIHYIVDSRSTGRRRCSRACTFWTAWSTIRA